MNRNEACELITRIAQDELIDMQVSREFLKARDIVICEPNKILDVLASPETRKLYKEQLIADLIELSENRMIDFSVRKDSRLLATELKTGDFKYKCIRPFIKARCKACPNYNGEK